MYKRPELKEYRDKWLKAERKLMVNGIRVNDEHTRDDFMDALKKASQRIEKPKPSPEQSET
jgi:hypothetical protein